MNWQFLRKVGPSSKRLSYTYQNLRTRSIPICWCLSSLCERRRIKLPKLKTVFWFMTDLSFVFTRTKKKLKSRNKKEKIKIACSINLITFYHVYKTVWDFMFHSSKKKLFCCVCERCCLNRSDLFPLMV